jgi:integrase
LFPAVSAATARDTAKVLAGDVASGIVAKELRAKSAPTLETALAIYLDNSKIRSDRNRELTEMRIRKHLEDWFQIPLDEITREMCATRHKRISIQRGGVNARGRQALVGGERSANHVMKTFRAIYNVALKTIELPVNPTIGVTFNDEEPPKTIIDDLDEWRTVVDDMHNPTNTAFYKFLLMTGLRRNEALTLKWDQIFDDHLHLPETKNGRTFDLPLLKSHHAILDPLRIYNSEWVFAAANHDKHITEPQRMKWSPWTCPVFVPPQVLV